MSTGTLAPLQNQREYTENEKIVLEYFFTNIDKNVYCAKTTLSSQLRAFLVGQYSRSHLSLRDRFLQLFGDQKKALDKLLISEDEFFSVDDLAEMIEKQGNIKLDFFENKASDFLRKWGVDYGHNSLKDSDTIRFVVEGISETFTNIIQAPFPTLGNFQEKSTRYLPFGKESLIFPSEVEESKYCDEIKKLDYEAIDIYEKYLPQVQHLLDEQDILDKSSFKSEKAYKNTLAAKSFDILRYVLPCNVSTSMGASFSTRTVESHLSRMMSLPMGEVQLLAKTMHEEALKLSPGLLTFVGINDYTLAKREKLNNLIDKKYGTNIEGLPIYKGIDNKQRVKLLDCGNLDNHILASLLFEESGHYGYSYDQCMQKVESLSDDEKMEILEVSFADRGKFDRMPRALQHSTIMFEFFLDFGAYRDVMRHRASKQIWQDMTAIHGYDYPELIDLPGMEGFKAEYDEVMLKFTQLSRKLVSENKSVVQYCGCMGHLVRTTYEMDPGQIAYVIELRTTPHGHYSYRNLFLEVYDYIKSSAPLFSKFIRVGVKEVGSRKAQEEESAQRRKELGIESD